MTLYNLRLNSRYVYSVIKSEISAEEGNDIGFTFVYRITGSEPLRYISKQILCPTCPRKRKYYHVDIFNYVFEKHPVTNSHSHKNKQHCADSLSKRPMYIGDKDIHILRKQEIYSFLKVFSEIHKENIK